MYMSPLVISHQPLEQQLYHNLHMSTHAPKMAYRFSVSCNKPVMNSTLLRERRKRVKRWLGSDSPPSGWYREWWECRGSLHHRIWHYRGSCGPSTDLYTHISDVRTNHSVKMQHIMDIQYNCVFMCECNFQFSATCPFNMSRKTQRFNYFMVSTKSEMGWAGWRS